MRDDSIKRIEKLEALVEKQEEAIRNLTAIATELTVAVANHSDALKVYDVNISKLCDTIVESISGVSNSKKEE